jgi:hypothetical protein
MKKLSFSALLLVFVGILALSAITVQAFHIKLPPGRSKIKVKVAHPSDNGNEKTTFVSFKNPYRQENSEEHKVVLFGRNLEKDYFFLYFPGDDNNHEFIISINTLDGIEETRSLAQDDFLEKIGYSKEENLSKSVCLLDIQLRVPHDRTLSHYDYYAPDFCPQGNHL